MIELYSPRGQLVQAPEAAIDSLIAKGYKLKDSAPQEAVEPVELVEPATETVDKPAPKRRGRKPKAE